MEYAAIKAVHLAAVVVSGSLFLVRGLWMLRDSPRLRQRWVRIVPHVNDTFLLAAGVWMAVLSGQAPGRHAWLTAKIVALLVYIALGSIALRPGRTQRVRVAAWLAALAVFAYIVAVALKRDPWLGL